MVDKNKINVYTLYMKHFYVSTYIMNIFTFSIIISYTIIKYYFKIQGKSIQFC